MKKGDGVVYKIITGAVFAFMLVMLSGCSDSELEHKNTQLKRNLENVKINNIQLKSRLNKEELNNKSFQKELIALRENNKGLNISLAKAELLFSQKYKVKFEAESKKLDSEREAFKQEKKKIEKESYENAEVAVNNKYLMVLGSVSILLIFLFIFLLS